MIPEIVIKWEKNKINLKKYFENTNQSEYQSYESIVRKIFELVITDVDNKWGGKDSFDIKKMTVIDDGDYQGTTIYIIPKDTYQPDTNDYLVTDNYYGSCSGCDTLLSISGYDDNLPNEKQVKEYMTIALHLVQRMKWLNSED